MGIAMKIGIGQRVIPRVLAVLMDTEGNVLTDPDGNVIYVLIARKDAV